MTPSRHRLRALLGAALGLALAAPAGAATTPKAPAADASPTKTTQKAAQQRTTGKATAEATAKPSPKATTAKAPSKSATTPGARATAKPAASQRTAAPRKKGRAAPAGDEIAADGVVETECYRLTRGKGRCEPQCLPYTRCRSGITSCRIGHENGPVTWFNCEQARGNTSLTPADGRVLVLGRNRHNMSTGHTLYVERTEPRGDGRYDLVLSHTNYDRRCNLETNMRAEYDPIAKTIDVRSGKWEPWGRDLRVSGFIHD